MWVLLQFGQDDDDGDEEEVEEPPQPEPEPESEEETDQELHEMWMEVDADRSGTLDRSEIAAVLKKMGLSAEQEDVDDAMTGFDEDGNGTIDYDEFIDWYKAVQKTGKLTAVAAEEAEAPLPADELQVHTQSIQQLILQDGIYKTLRRSMDIV